MVPVNWAGFFKLVWYRNHPKIWSGSRFLKILVCQKSARIIFPGKSRGSGFSLSGETFRSPYQVGVRRRSADCLTDKTQYFWVVGSFLYAIYRMPRSW